MFCSIRCGKCLTKNWCSRDCQEKDWEEKHQEFCIKDADQRKVRGGAEVRRKAGMKSLRKGIREALAVNADKPVELQMMVSEVKELCKKKEKRVSTGPRVVASSSEEGPQE